jgi:putative phosphoesterase
MSSREWSVGLISDTHGLLRPNALSALSGSDLIIHAGDIGTPEVIDTLQSIAPVLAVRGNVDRGQWADAYPAHRVVCVGDIELYVLHDLQELASNPAAESVKVIVSGHSHQPRIERRAGVLYVNPGSAGPRRFRLPISCARLRIRDHEPHAELLELADQLARAH